MLSLSIVLVSILLLLSCPTHAGESPKCGLSPVVNDHTTLRQFPWMVHIFMWIHENVRENFAITSIQDKPLLGIFPKTCTGSLIDDKWILTSAKCFSTPFGYKIKSIEIKLWPSNIFEYIDDDESLTFYNSTKYHELKVYFHEKYNSTSHDDEHDIALIKLSSKIKFEEFSNKISPICLPVAGEMMDKTNCQQLGWHDDTPYGRTSKYNIILNWTNVSVLDSGTCMKKLNVSSLKDKLCAGDAQHNLCPGRVGGANGGPLQCMNAASQWVLQGVRSTRDYKCNASGPYEQTLFTDVSKYIHWINETMINSERIPQKPIPRDLKCGRSAVSNARIVGGGEAKRHQYPWMAYLKVSIVERFSGNLTNIKFCGGVLIDDQWVLTAAHCFSVFNEMFLANDTRVLLGAHNITDKSESRLEIEANKIFPHDKYDSHNLDDPYGHDIALVKLATRINFTQTDSRIAPICVPELGEMISKTDCQIVGWGRTNASIVDDSHTLRVANVNLLDNAVCREHYPFDHVNEWQLCAGGTDKVPCTGDSGGPVQCRNAAGQWVAMGVTSFGHKKCDVHYPHVFTDVLKHETWIYMIRALHSD